VGQAIFKLQQPLRKRALFSVRAGKNSVHGHAPDTWTSLVSRSILFRVHPEIRSPSAQSGTAVCILEKLDDGTKCARVAGFTAFVQEVSAVQVFELEGPQLYSKLLDGRVAFYGAFQVPEKLREEHIIL
jgi:hypothetical protein